MWDLWPVIVVGIVVAYFALRYRETFVIKYGNPFDNEDLISFDPNAKGTRLFSTTPDTCPLDRLDLDAGLCYTPCEEGYRGVGPVCWANTKNIGVGTMASLRSCSESGYSGWNDWGLVCQQPITCAKGLAFFREGCKGGNVRAKKLGCPGNQPAFFSLLTSALSGSSEKPNLNEYTDLADGLCYKPCPKDKPRRVAGMPYLCYKGERGLSYGRGAGTVPPLFHFGA